MNDPIADFLVRIKNTLLRKEEIADIPYSKIKERILNLLVEEGYLQRFEVLSRMQKKFLRVTMKYGRGKKPVICGLKRISKLGCRVYVTAENIPWVQSGYGTAILSTSLGIITDQQAREKHVGGEVLCYIW